MVRVDGVSGEAARRRRRRRASVFLGPRVVRKRIHGPFADDIGQPTKFGCSQRDTLALRQQEAKPREQPCAGRPQWLSTLVRKPQQRCAGARRWIRPPATVTFKRAKIAFGRFWQRPRRCASALSENDAPLLLAPTGPAEALEQRRPPRRSTGPHRPVTIKRLRRDQWTGFKRRELWVY